MALLWFCAAAQAERYTVPLLVPAGASGNPVGLVRILNATEASGSVEIYAIDDAGARSGPAEFTLAAFAGVDFTASDLAAGNAMKGLTGGVGTLSDNVRLEIESDVRIVPAAYVRGAGGSLSAMHDTVRAMTASGGGYEYRVPVFNPSTETVHVSSLRLINPGAEAASVTIGGRSDDGAMASGGTVGLTLAGGASRTLTAGQLEAGDEGLTGRLGAGSGRWRLTVSSDARLQVVNVVSSTAAGMNNLSTTAADGSAPADHAAFIGRFLGVGIEYRRDSSDVTFTAGAGDTFGETGEAGGMAVSFTGSYAYAATGPDAGRVTLSYDDGDACTVNLYFATLSSGWFASSCTAAGQSNANWTGGQWSISADEDDGDGGGDPVTATYGVDEALPGVPTSGSFVPSALVGGGSVTSTADGTTITLNDGAYFELSDGTRYTCASAGGCAIADGTVTRGTVTGTSPGTGEVDRFPTFPSAANPGNRTYTAGTAIDTLTLPEASGGNGTLTYRLSPNVPGLTFNAVTRQLTGTPTTAGTHSMTYTVADEDGDTDTLGFTITVGGGTTEAGSLGVCQVGMMLSSGQSCTYPDTTDAFSVNARGRGSFLSFLAGIRIRINNQTINGRVYDFEASHQGDGVWRIDRIAGSTEPTAGDGDGDGDGTDTGETANDTSPSFTAGSAPGNQTYTAGTAIDTLTLPEAGGGNGTLTYSLSPNVPGLSFDAATRQLTGTPTTAGTYSMTYTVTDEDADSDSLTFTVTVDDPGDGQSTTFGAGDTLSTLPSGSWFPDTTSGGSFTSSAGVVTINLDNGGYIEEGSYRYTCQSAGGCTVRDGVVQSGTIARTAKGTAPGDGTDGGTEPTGPPWSGAISVCSGAKDSVFDTTADMTIEGTITAIRSMSNVRVSGYAGLYWDWSFPGSPPEDNFVGSVSLGNMAAGETESFSMTGTVYEPFSSTRCGVGVEFDEAASFGGDNSAPLSLGSVLDVR